MKSTWIAVILLVVLNYGCSNHENTSRKEFALVIHGGAGTIKKENLSDSLEEAYRNTLETAINKGKILLKEGQPAKIVVS